MKEGQTFTLTYITAAHAKEGDLVQIGGAFLEVSKSDTVEIPHVTAETGPQKPAAMVKTVRLQCGPSTTVDLAPEARVGVLRPVPGQPETQ